MEYFPTLEAISSPETWAALVTLTMLEIVLGVDNIIFLSILVAKLPPEQQPRARSFGLMLAALSRIALLLSIVWVMRLTHPLFSVLGMEISGRDLILVGGGLFLLAKATMEIHEKLEGAEGEASARAYPSFVAVIMQIAILDIVFSLDSVITAVGMAKQVWIMVLAILLAVAFMLWSAARVHDFIERHPTVKILALSFLILVGMALVAEGFEFHVPKGYIYFAMAFSVFVEIINIRMRRVPREPVKLREPYTESLEGPRA